MLPDSPFWPLIGLAFVVAFAIFLLFVALAGLLIRWLPFRDPRTILREIFGPATHVEWFQREPGGYSMAFHAGANEVRLQLRRGAWMTTVDGRPVQDLEGGLAARLRRLRQRLSG